jgi:hypothetical protein
MNNTQQNSQYNYVDTINGIYIADGVLRFDLATVIDPNPNQGTPNSNADNIIITRVGGVAMSLNGFVRIFNQMNQLANKMMEQGLLKKNEKDGQATTEPQAEIKSDIKVETKKKSS